MLNRCNWQPCNYLAADAPGPGSESQESQSQVNHTQF